MPRQLEHRSLSKYPAADMYATMIDPEYLEARLADMGGARAALLEHHSDDAGARYRLRHGLDAKDLPSMVRNLVPGDIIIERTEIWTRAGSGAYDGQARVEIPGTPASAEGGSRLRDSADGSELMVRMSVTVKVPFLGGTIETVIAEQVTKLLAAETAFTLQWLAKQG